MIGVVARAVVGGVLLWAGLAKLRERSWALLALEAGTPRSVVVALPIVESMLGLALVLQVVPRVVGWSAVALFAAFTVVIVQRVRSGSRAPCNCFGGSRQDPVGPITIARNIALLVIAVIGAVV